MIVVLVCSKTKLELSSLPLEDTELVYGGKLCVSVKWRFTGLCVSLELSAIRLLWSCSQVTCSRVPSCGCGKVLRKIFVNFLIEIPDLWMCLMFCIALHRICRKVQYFCPIIYTSVQLRNDKSYLCLWGWCKRINHLLPMREWRAQKY